MKKPASATGQGASSLLYRASSPPLALRARRGSGRSKDQAVESRGLLIARGASVDCLRQEAEQEIGGLRCCTCRTNDGAVSHAVLVLDGAGYHIAAALTIPENVTLVRLPPYAPELNPIENVWEYLRGNKLAITVFDDYDDIVDKACEAWNFFEQDPNALSNSA
jgi:DDE superfamily endonuclease